MLRSSARVAPAPVSPGKSHLAQQPNSQPLTDGTTVSAIEPSPSRIIAAPATHRDATTTSPHVPSIVLPPLPRRNRTTTPSVQCPKPAIEATVRSHLANIDNLVLEGGGPNGFIYFSVLRELTKQGFDVAQLTGFAGTSAGACISSLFAMGLSVDEVEAEVDRINHENLQDGMWGCLPCRVIGGWGLYEGKNWTKIWRNTMRTWWLRKVEGKSEVSSKDLKQCIDPTFKMLQDSRGIKFVATGTNLTKQCLTIYSPETTPDMPIYEAVSFSSRVPGVWYPHSDSGHCPKSKKGDIIVDGGMLCNFPLWVFDHKDPYKAADRSNDPNMKSLGLKMISPYQEATNDCIQPGWTGKDITRLGSYANAIFNTMYAVIEKLHVREREWDRTVPCKITKEASIAVEECAVSPEKSILLNECGARSADQWVKKLGDRLTKK